jgi:hypothetical protein
VSKIYVVVKIGTCVTTYDSDTDDYEEIMMAFETLEEAEKYVATRSRGYYDIKQVGVGCALDNS